MKDTGEQFIPGVSSSRLSDEHYNRYKFIKKIVKNKKVLDVACGAGYGTYEISKTASCAVGVDVSEGCIEAAKSNYKNNNLKFIKAECSSMEFSENYFDVIVSYETIEHIEEEGRKKFYNLCRKFLKKDGLFIVSTPNKRVTSPRTKAPLNKHHVIEFRKKELLNELSNYFNIEKVFGQRFIATPFLWWPVERFIRLIEKITKKDLGVYSTLFSAQVGEWRCLCEPRIFLLIMSNKNEKI